MRLPSTLGFVSLLTLITASAFAESDGVGRIEDGVPAPNAATGSPATQIDPDFKTRVIVTGNDPLENPIGVFIKFGMLSDGTRTEPDQNTPRCGISTRPGTAWGPRRKRSRRGR